MSGLFSRAAAGLVSSIALALAGLVLTSFFDPKPERGAEAAHSVQMEGIDSRPWCGPVRETGVTSCRYSTFEQCLLAARADYRTCKPNPAGAAIHDDMPYRTYRSVFL